MTAFLVPKSLLSMARKAPTPEILIQWIQIGLGVRDKYGLILPMPLIDEDRVRRKSKLSYKHYQSILEWLGTNYPDKGWFYAAQEVWKTINPNINTEERLKRNRQYRKIRG